MGTLYIKILICFFIAITKYIRMGTIDIKIFFAHSSQAALVIFLMTKCLIYHLIKEKIYLVLLVPESSLIITWLSTEQWGWGDDSLCSYDIRPKSRESRTSSRTRL